MVARTQREILRWLEGLYLTYPVVVPKCFLTKEISEIHNEVFSRDLANGYSYAEILRAYFPQEINMFAFINGRSLNSRLLNWAVIKKFVKNKEFPISKEFIEATIHEKDGAAEQLLEQTYELLTNKKVFADPKVERDSEFSDRIYQQNLSFVERSHTSKLIKNNLKSTEILTDPCYAHQAKRSANIVNRSKLDRQASRIDHPERFDIRPSLAQRCFRRPLRPNSNAQDWFIKSFESRSRSETNITDKSASVRHSSQPISPDLRKKSSMSKKHGDMEIHDETGIYKEIVLRQHAVPYSAFLLNQDV